MQKISQYLFLTTFILLFPFTLYADKDQFKSSNKSIYIPDNDMNITTWLKENKDNIDKVIKETTEDRSTIWIDEKSLPSINKNNDNDTVTNSNNHNLGTNETTYTVLKGDTLFGIAKKNNVNLDDLLTWNNLTKNSTIYPGMILKIYTHSNYALQENPQQSIPPVETPPKEEVIPLSPSNDY